MADKDDDRDSLAPHPFGMPEERRVPAWVVPVVAAAVGIVLLAGGVAVFVVTRHSTARPARSAGVTPPSHPASGSVATSALPSASGTESVAATTSTDASGVAVTLSQPAAPGTKLHTLETPPDRTEALIVVPRGFSGADFTIVFTPYGLGPTGPTGGTLIAKVVSSKPVGSAARALRRGFAGDNVAMYCSPTVLASITGGGRYRGTLRVRPQGDVGVLLLTQAVAER